MSIKFYDGATVSTADNLVAELAAGADSSAAYDADSLSIGAKGAIHFNTDIHGTHKTLGGFANDSFYIQDGTTAPSTSSGYAYIYVDTADGDLKVKFGDGTVKTLATDT